MTTLLIATLGPFQIALGDEPVEGITSEKIQSLLAHLGLGERQPLSREMAAELLWPDRAPGVARRNLRQALKRLQDALPEPEGSPPFLLTDRETLRLNPRAPIRFDVVEFNAALTFTREHTHHQLHRCRRCGMKLTEAVELYRGDFLEGIITGSRPLDEWILLQREWLRREALGALHALGAHHFWKGDFERAYVSAHRQVALDPLREAGHRQVIRSLALAGRRQEALDQYRSLKRLLAQELGVSPSGKSRQLYEQVRSGELEGPSDSRSLTQTLDLPLAASPFVGREEELAAIAERLDHPDCRLLTLVGLGGSGKTRLAVQTGLEKGDEFEEGIAFVALDSVESETALLTTVAGSLGLTFSGLAQDDDARQDRLLNYLEDRELLLILDNYEQLLPETGLLIALLSRTTQLKILVTSREPLHLQAEWLLDIPGLSFPEAVADDLGDGSQVEQSDMLAYEAIQLFYEAARRLQADFSLSPEILPAVSRVCQLVDGLPLALELAATWLRRYQPNEIVRALETSLDFLTSTMRDLPQRHRSLRAVFNHSWDLLDPAESRALARLSVFRGQFAQSAAEAVAGVTPGQLADLADKSLLRQTSSDGYELHELIRQYAAEKLGADAAEEAAARDRHSDYYARWLEELEGDLYGPRVISATEEVAAKLGNLRAAWRWAVESARLETLQRAVLPLARFFTVTSSLREGQEALALASQELADRRAGGDPRAWRRLMASIWAEQARFLNLKGEYHRALSVISKAVEAAQEIRDQGAEASASLQRGISLWRQGDFEEAADRLSKAFNLAQQAEKHWPTSVRHAIEGESQRILGYVFLNQGRYPLAREHYEAALQIHRQAGNRWAEAYVLGGIGNILVVQDQVEAAIPYYEQALEMLEEMGDTAGETTLLDNLGTIHLAQGKFEQAGDLYQRALSLRRRVGDRRGEGASLGKLGLLADAVGDYDAATANYQLALSIYRAIGYRLGIATILARQSLLLHHQGDDRGALKEGREALEIAINIGDRSYQAYAHMALGHSLAGLGRLQAAAGHYEQALALRQEMGESNRTMEALAGLAEVALADREPAQAMQYAESILEHLDTAGLEPCDEPLRVYLTCYRVLEETGDRRAREVLQSAYQELQRRAKSIGDETGRRAFLANVPAHRKLVTAWNSQ